jgi:hypothetical protein
MIGNILKNWSAMLKAASTKIITPYFITTAITRNHFDHSHFQSLFLCPHHTLYIGIVNKKKEKFYLVDFYLFGTIFAGGFFVLRDIVKAFRFAAGGPNTIRDYQNKCIT